MTTILLFILILGVLVLVHEFGHFVTARAFRMKVHEFGFGFPPRAFGIYRDPQTKKYRFIWGRGKSSLVKTVGGEARETEDEFPTTVYSFNWLPLGGFVKIKGENGEGRGEQDSFMSKAAWKRVVVLVAGVVMNFLLAAVVLGIGLMIGLPADFSQGVDPQATVVEQPHVLVQQVSKGMPADAAGISFGDKILSINEETIDSVEELITYVGDKAGHELQVKIQRGEQELAISITPEYSQEVGRAVFGVMPADAGIIRYPWYLALYKGFVAAAFGLINIFITFYLLLKNLVMGQGLLFDVSGPVGIAVLVGQSARLGLNYILHVTASISLGLAAINILPIPALDGGRILFVLLEKIIGRPVSMKYEQLAHTIGFVLLMGLIVVVTWRDIVGLF